MSKKDIAKKDQIAVILITLAITILLALASYFFIQFVRSLF